jgi:hypothetical protein
MQICPGDSFWGHLFQTGKSSDPDQSSLDYFYFQKQELSA